MPRDIFDEVYDESFGNHKPDIFDQVYDETFGDKITPPQSLAPPPPSQTRLTGGISSWDQGLGEMAPDFFESARKATEQQKQLGLLDRAGLKLGAGLTGLAKIGDAIINAPAGAAQWAMGIAPENRWRSTMAPAAREIFSQYDKLAPDLFDQYSDTAANLAPLPTGVAGVGAKLLPKVNALKTWNDAIAAGKFLPAIADTATAGAATGMALSAGNTVANDEEIDPLEVFLSGAVGGLAGGGISALTHASGLPQLIYRNGKLELKAAPMPDLEMNMPPSPTPEQQALLKEARRLERYKNAAQRTGAEIPDLKTAAEISQPTPAELTDPLEALAQDPSAGRWLQLNSRQQKNILPAPPTLPPVPEAKLPVDPIAELIADIQSGDHSAIYRAATQVKELIRGLPKSYRKYAEKSVDFAIAKRLKELEGAPPAVLTPDIVSSPNTALPPGAVSIPDSVLTPQAVALPAVTPNTVPPAVLTPDTVHAPGMSSGASQNVQLGKGSKNADSFRQRRTQYGYDRTNKDAVSLEELQELVNLSPDETTRLQAVMSSAARAKYYEALLEDASDKVFRKFAKPNEDSVKVGKLTLKRSVTPRKNSAIEDKIAVKRAEMVQEQIESGVDTPIPTASKELRGILDAEFGQGKSSNTLEQLTIPDNPEAAAYLLGEIKTLAKDARDAYTGSKRLETGLVRDLEDRLRKSTGDQQRQFFVRGDVDHPAGAQYGRVASAVELYHQSRPAELVGEFKERYEEAAKLLRDQSKGKLDSFIQKINEVDRQMRGSVGSIPALENIQQEALKAIQKMGYKGKSLPADIKTGAVRYTGKFLEEAAEQSKKQGLLSSAAARGSLMALSGLMWQADQEAEAAPDKRGQKKDEIRPMQALASLLFAGAIGGGAAVKGIGALAKKAKSNNLAPGSALLEEARKGLNAGLTLWRDTMDQVKIADQVANSLSAGTGREFSLFKRINEVGGESIMHSWGVKFDDNLKRQEAILALRDGAVKPDAALRGEGIFAGFDDAQRKALAMHHKLTRGLAKEMEAQIQLIEAGIKEGKITKDRITQNALEGLKYAYQKLSPRTSAEIDNDFGRLVKTATANAMDWFFFWNPDHHTLNLADSLIAGSATVGPRNIGRAWKELAANKEVKNAFRNANLIGGREADRVELKAELNTRDLRNRGELPPETKFQKFKKKAGEVLSNDLPSDKFNADRVALASLLQYAQFNKKAVQGLGFQDDLAFALGVVKGNPKIMQTEHGLAAAAHMYDQLSRTLGVDGLRINTHVLNRSPMIKNMVVFLNQPARYSRLVMSPLIDAGAGNWGRVASSLGILSLLAGRSVLPKDLEFLRTEEQNPDLYFGAAKAFDNLNILSKATGANIANKSDYALLYPLMGVSNPGVQNLANLPGRLQKIYSNDADLLTKVGESVKALLPITGTGKFKVPSGQIFRTTDALDEMLKGERKVYLKASPYQGFSAKREIDLQEVGPFDPIFDRLLPGRSQWLDTMEMSYREDKARKAKAEKAQQKKEGKPRRGRGQELQEFLFYGDSGKARKKRR